MGRQVLFLSISISLFTESTFTKRPLGEVTVNYLYLLNPNLVNAKT